MSKMIQIRDVPDDIHRTLKSRAALAGMSMSDYLLAEMKRVVETPSRAEILERIARRKPVRLRESAARAVRAEREAR